MQFEVFIIVTVTMVTRITLGYSKLGERNYYLQYMRQIKPLYQGFFFSNLYAFITNLKHRKWPEIIAGQLKATFKVHVTALAAD